MSAPAAASLISVEEYLRNPAYRHSEYVGGRIVQRAMGTKEHGYVQGRCFRKFDEYFDTHEGGSASIEAHCRFLVNGELRFRLPDVCVILDREDDTDSPYLERAPDLAVEVRSPEDKVSDILRKLDEYFAAGTRLAWVVLPDEQAVLVRTTDGRITVAAAGGALDGGDVLPGFELAVDDLFR
jgi:Uma2 family endonuclease